jgi:hypothetical protein
MFIFGRSITGPVAALILSVSLRKLWAIHIRTAGGQGKGSRGRDLASAQVAFYSGAHGVLKVLAHMVEQGDSDAALRTIRRFGKQVKLLPNP